jgi:hypothetical protein
VQEKIVDPWENVIDDEDRQYLQFKKETGRGRKDFDSLNVDYDTVSSLDLARERVRKESGQSFTNEQADLYLERKLGIDLSDLSDLQDYDNIEWLFFLNQCVRKKKAEQKNTNNHCAKSTFSSDEIVNLDNGTSMKKVVTMQWY